MLDAVGETFAGVPLSGATFEGIIGQGLADESMYAVQVIGMKSATVQFHNFICSDSVGQPLEAGEQLGRSVAEVESPGNRVLFLFPDFRTNATSLFKGIERHCSLPFIGGASADNLKFLQSYQFHNGDVFDHSCAGVLMTGAFDMRTIVTHGSEPLGRGYPAVAKIADARSKQSEAGGLRSSVFVRKCQLQFPVTQFYRVLPPSASVSPF